MDSISNDGSQQVSLCGAANIVPSDKTLICFHGFKVDCNQEVSPKFTCLEMLGAGAFGVVYRGLCSRGCEVAIKRVEKTFFRVLHEKRNFEYLADNKHPNIINYFGCYFEDDSYHFVMENGGIDLVNYLIVNGKTLTLGKFNNIAFQGLNALIYLNEIGFSHGEFELKSMLWHVPTDKLKVIDFGLSRLKSDKDYCSPLSELRSFGLDLAKLQLDMKFNVGLPKSASWLNCEPHFYTDNYSTLISLKDIWCDKLDQPAIEAVAYSSSSSSASGAPLPKDVIKIRDSLSDKERLVDNA